MPNQKLKVDTIYRQVFVIAGGIITSGILASLYINPKLIYISLVLSTAMTFFGLIGFCPMLFLLRSLPFNKKK